MADSTIVTDRTMTCKECGLKLTGADLLKATRLRDQHEDEAHPRPTAAISTHQGETVRADVIGGGDRG